MVTTCINVEEDQVGLLIGKGGEVKKTIERMAGVTLKIEECLVTIIGEDGFKVMKAGDVVKAISQGMPPKQAFDLFGDDHQLAVFDIEEVVTNQAALERQKARIIGEKGKAKKFFEATLGLKIHIGDSKVTAVGSPEKLKVFREALERLVHGAPHSAVYRYVEARLAGLRAQNGI
ncbi:MAG TPA: RNA-processing protein [archaeon]|nr:RNA-processing protein [archaeon]